MLTAEEQAEDEGSRVPTEATVLIGRRAPELPLLPKVEKPLAMLLNESPSKGEPKMPLIGSGGAKGWEVGR